MANTKISAMTPATGLLLADEFAINESGVSKKITGTLLSNSFPYLISTLSGASATYDFTSITATWRELEIRFYIRDTSATNGVTNCVVTLNADAAANYYNEVLQIHGTTTTVPGENIAATGMNIGCVGGGSTANLHSAGELRIQGYKGAGLKNMVADLHVPTAITTTNLNRYVLGSVWNNVAAITRITLTPPTGFDANSYAQLWGLGS